MINQPKLLTLLVLCSILMTTNSFSMNFFKNFGKKIGSKSKNSTYSKKLLKKALNSESDSDQSLEYSSDEENKKNHYGTANENFEKLVCKRKNNTTDLDSDEFLSDDSDSLNSSSDEEDSNLFGTINRVKKIKKNEFNNPSRTFNRNFAHLIEKQQNLNSIKKTTYDSFLDDMKKLDELEKKQELELEKLKSLY